MSFGTVRVDQWPLGMLPGAMLVLVASIMSLTGRLQAAETTQPHVMIRPTQQAETTLQPVPPGPRPRVGERLVFRGRWLGLPVGAGWIGVTEEVVIDGRRAFHIHGEGKTTGVVSKFYPVHDVVDSYLDAETLQPLRFEKNQREGDYRANEIVIFDVSKREARYESLLNKSKKRIELPEEFQDLISALYWFRIQPVLPGSSMMVNLYTDEKIYRTQMMISRLMTLELLKRGTFTCFVVEPKASFKGMLVKRGRLWAYLTADEWRLPLLVKATTPWGPMSAVLEEESLPVAWRR